MEPETSTRIEDSPTSQSSPPIVNAEQKRNSYLGDAKELAEFLSKLAPLIAGTIYISGYIVTAQRLADYGVPVTQLLNAQYFTAGVAPGLLLCLTVAVGYFAVTWQSKTGNRLQSIAGWIIAVLVLGMFGFIGLNWLVARLWGVSILDKWHWLDSYVSVPVRAFLGLITFWYLIAGLRNGTLLKMLKYSRQFGQGFWDTLQGIVIVMVIGLGSLVLSYLATARVFDAIPQAYGGGKPLNVRLYVEREKTPKELIATTTDNAENSLAYTIPLRLVFQTSDSLIVSPAEGNRPVWTIDAAVVHAVLSNP